MCLRKESTGDHQKCLEKKLLRILQTANTKSLLNTFKWYTFFHTFWKVFAELSPL